MQINIIEQISNSCSCSHMEAQEYLDSEIRYLRELQEADDLREDDIEMACSNLGLDLDNQEYFINRLAGWKSHSTLTLLATQNYPFLLKYDCPLWLK